MTKRNIVIVTCAGGYFGQGDKVWKSIDVLILKQRLEGYGRTVHIRDYEGVAKDIGSVRESYILYSSTQRPGYKNYIEDVLLGLQHLGNILLPSFDLFRAHENKGYQEILRQLRGIDCIPGKYFSHYDDSMRFHQSLPAVYKDTYGSKSSSVSLVRTQSELKRKLSKAERLSPYWKLHRTFNRLFKRSESCGWYTYIKPYHPFVLQQFVPELKHDFKVLAFGNNFFVLKRRVRKDDFRASGSGMLEFVEPDHKLLDYARELHKQLDCPYVSIDVVETRCGYGLVEFQAVCFGPVTLTKSPFHYTVKDGKWEKVVGRSSLETEMAEAIVAYT